MDLGKFIYIPYDYLILTFSLVSLFEFIAITLLINNFKKTYEKTLFLISELIKNAILFSHIYLETHYGIKSGYIQNVEQAIMFTREYMIAPKYYMLLIITVYVVYNINKSFVREKNRFLASLIIFNLLVAIIIFLLERILCYGSF